MVKKKIAVIGAGLGGLSAAICLAARGYRVDVFEQNEVCGGKAFSVVQDGFRFDAGPSLVTMPFVFDRLFERAGADREAELLFRRLPVTCRYFFADGTRLDAVADLDAYAAAIARQIGEPASQVRAFFSYAGRIYDVAGRLFLLDSPFNPRIYSRPATWRALVRMGRIDMGRSMHRALRSFFRDPRALQLFSRYATYSGSNPYVAPATLNLIPYVEQAFGAWAPAGGIVAIPRALENLARRRNVMIHNRVRVEKILTRGRRACGIQVNGEKLSYDAIISNADVRATYHTLLSDRHTPAARRYDRLEPSTSGIVFLWGMRRQFPRLDTHTIFFSTDYQREFRQLFHDRTCPDEPTVYVNISSRYAPADAPAGAENWFVLLNAPYHTGQDWMRSLPRVRAAVISRVEQALAEPVERHIASETVLTPADIAQRTAGEFGSIYGISSNSRAAAFLRQANREASSPGLYFCGGSAHPGGGMPLALLSGMIAADMLDSTEGGS